MKSSTSSHTRLCESTPESHHSLPRIRTTSCGCSQSTVRLERTACMFLGVPQFSTMVKSRSPNDSNLSELMGAIYLVLQVHVPRFNLRQMCVTYLTAGNRGKAAYVPWYSLPDSGCDFCSVSLQRYVGGLAGATHPGCVVWNICICAVHY